MAKKKKNKQPLPQQQMVGTKAKTCTVEEEYMGYLEDIMPRLIKPMMTELGYKRGSIPAVRRIKRIIAFVFSILNGILISLRFFHLPWYVTLLWIVNLVAFILFYFHYDNISYIQKEIESRPDDDMENIVASLLSAEDKTRHIPMVPIFLILSVLIPCGVFYQPKVFYEKAEDGYHVRFYAYGIANDTSVEIPAEHKGLPVTGIRGDVFKNMKHLETVTLPDSINTIRGNAFRKCTSLTDVHLPAGLTYLGGSAFSRCESLVTVELPEGLTYIGGKAFEYCDSLETMTLPGSLTYIGGSLFYDDENLKELYFEDGPTEINGNICYDCLSLTKVRLPETLVDLGGESFQLCASLTDINLPDGLTEIHGDTFQGCSSLESISIPAGVTRIGGHAFEDCSSLVSADVPSKCTEIGSSAFRRCYALETIRVPQGCSVNERAFKESPTQVEYY